MALEKNTEGYLEAPAHLQQGGLAHRLLSTRLYQEVVLARALKINIKWKSAFPSKQIMISFGEATFSLLLSRAVMYPFRFPFLSWVLANFDSPGEY